MAFKILPSIIFTLCFALFCGETAFAICNPYKGHWAYDKSYPLYDPASCPFISKDYDCVKYGRRDPFYLKYRWQPDSCDLPRFDGMNLLKKYRGKRIMFVGDSLGYDQYQSLVCLIHATAPNVRTTKVAVPEMHDVVRFEGYNMTVEYYLSHYFVDILLRRIGNQVAKVLDFGSMSAGRVWQGADVLIFDTGHWFYANYPWNYTRDGNKLTINNDGISLFTKAVQAWSKWVDQTIDPSKTKVIYQSMSPDHYHGENWGAPRTQTCMGQKRPLNPSQIIAGPMPQEAIVKNILRTMKKTVHLLDISYLSQLRIDAHPSKYNGIRNRTNDCTHWCVPGLPDTWNVLLYSLL
ncbi:hypothetical protein LUZ60_012512 [Juncus effusus]|nr:hypothetical protein LUZ60_012512 [Juncus effusus]